MIYGIELSELRHVSDYNKPDVYRFVMSLNVYLSDRFFVHLYGICNDIPFITIESEGNVLSLPIYVWFVHFLFLCLNTIYMILLCMCSLLKKDC